MVSRGSLCATKPQIFVLCFADTKNKREELNSVKEEIVVFSLRTDWQKNDNKFWLLC